MKSMKMQLLPKFTALTFLIISLAILSSCGDNPSNPSNNEEHDLPTTLRLTLILLDSDGNPSTDTLVVTFDDKDGLGGNPPTVGTLTLISSPLDTLSFIGTIKLWNITSTGDSTNLNPVIEEEAEGHQFFFEPTEGANSRMKISYRDKESDYISTNLNGGDYPVGMKFLLKLAPGGAANDLLEVSLSHFDNPADKDGIHKSSETDVDILFPVHIINKK